MLCIISYIVYVTKMEYYFLFVFPFAAVINSQL